ncbi:DMT family transporter [Pseudomonas sp. 148P]|uniref:DMT family transporter n=1 Tax=Pseudomonas ulcerans TaxID=3115852 RepID=A0ABU7HV16_9PSED|nr:MULTISPECIES: DMT family transporter [unclassified Pseudomonas]MEE1923546.1 DMT family transporter [Pseudomonas sp. 147P]MEE1935387.1 DMT family transporter [Pseudomonas sp. 148P]
MAWVVALLIAAGAALVVQNLLMVHISSGVSTVLVALLLNSAVGLVVLLTLLLARSGMAGLGEMFATLRYWSVLPGVLGSFIVFASISGYQRLGAAAAISVLIASQLVVGLGVDMFRSGWSGLSPLLGVILLVGGAWLVASR